MPTYKFRNNNTGEVWEDFMSISGADKYLEENPHIERLVNGAPSLVSTAMGATTKPDTGFRDLLKEIKKKNSGGFTKSDINTF